MAVYKLLFTLAVTIICIQSVISDELVLPSFLRSKKCTEPGLMCKSCTELAYCIMNSDGTMIETFSEECPGGTTCMESSAKCTSEPNMLCETPSHMSFQCKQPGIFPDVFNCNKYHICVKESNDSDVYIDIEGKCNMEWVFDVKTSRCTKKLKTVECPALIPKCSTRFQSGAVSENPSYYYICQERKTSSGSTFLHPDLYLCQFNYVFKGTSCVDPTPSTGINSSGKCIAKGLYYNPKNCLKYSECKKAGAKPNGKTCAKGKYFVPERSACVTYSCLS